MSLLRKGRHIPCCRLLTYRARPGITERERERLITLDDCDPQSLEVARQVRTEQLLTRIGHSVHDDYVCYLLLDDFVTDFGAKLVVNNVIRGSSKPYSSDCSMR